MQRNVNCNKCGLSRGFSLGAKISPHALRTVVPNNKR